MTHYPVPALTCCVCGSAEWMAVRPGTAADARRYPTVPELHPCEEVETVAYCSAHWPWWKA